MADYVPAPTSIEEAESLIQALCINPARLTLPLTQSIRDWDQHGAGLFARAAKACHYYQHGHSLGITLRSLANSAIMIEHRRATLAKA